MLDTVMTLCQLPGVSSCEDQVRQYIQQRVAPFAQSVTVDAMGNLIVFKQGAKSTGNTLMFCAHMDEVGLMITRVTEDGFLKFDCVGGIDRRVLLGKRVVVGDGKIPGVIGLKAYHLVSRAEESKVPKLDEYYIDIGANTQEAAEKLVTLGDYVTFESDCLTFGDGLIKGKAIDDRIGCAVMIHLLEQDLPMDATFVFTVQEEVGARGAFGAAFSVQPKIAFILEGTTAADTPYLEGHKQVCAVGKGPVLSLMDGGAVYDRELFELLRAQAVTSEIPWQVKHYIAGGTDAQAIQRSRSGVRVTGLSAAVRYLHSANTVASIEDCKHIYQLTQAFLTALATQYE